MAVRRQVPTAVARAGTISALALATVGGIIPAPGVTGGAEASSVSAAALRIAASKKGAPYQFGARGPHRFDCSGLTQYAFRHAGKKLPRTAAAQYNHTRHLPASARRTGDLVFFHTGSGIYHVGIYAGRGRIWNAPRTGTVVRLDKIWSKAVWYGRVR
ncbi:C40 family peptidase [Streptomyces pinistramenti]|uniref:C40 family peptidase n=1 Tax=Streptomyces pinistramenti TaxID=2884812 RepID=UPI001D05D373|nr:NlpC/P60 family protein [Streptomyces pinistramenti]MCB5908998.1 NlpC/P60 family protein [Streptomyces pinistramenti]